MSTTSVPITPGGQAFRDVIAEVNGGVRMKRASHARNPTGFWASLPWLRHRAGHMLEMSCCRLAAQAYELTHAQGKPVVVDGAMGSTLYEQGILHTRAFEECNLNAAAKVKAVHLAFIEAGANVIEYVAAHARAHACLPTSCMRAHIGACLCLVHVFTPRIAISTPPAGQTRLAPTSTCWGNTACRTSPKSTRPVSALQKKLWPKVARACGWQALWAPRLCVCACFQ